jgi:predicted GNAT family acetyltransferase
VEKQDAAAQDEDLRIADNPRRSRYEVWVDGKAIAFSEYETDSDRVIFTHTVVRPEFEGRGIGSRLAKFALDDVRSRGLRITPVCPFIRSYLERHDDYMDLVDLPPAEQAPPD